MNNKQKLEFYKIYYSDLSPTKYNVQIEDENIIISNILKKNEDDKDFYKKGGSIKTWKQRYNAKHGFTKNKAHSLKDISKTTGVSLEGIQKIYNKGVGAWKTNIGSVRIKKDFSKNKDTVKYPRAQRVGKEQWAMARVYSAVMGGKAAKVDKKELKMEFGGDIRLKYIEKPTKNHENVINISKGEFENFDLTVYKEIPYPELGSQEEVAEMFYLNSLPLDAEFAYKYDYYMQVFYNYLRKHNLILSKSNLDELMDIKHHMGPIIMELKYFYNRPRPSQIAPELGLPIEFLELASAETPSYPSGHSCQGIFVGHFLSDLFPEHKEDLIQIGSDVGISRLIARVHYPTDDILGKYLGYAMYKYYKND